MAATSRSDAGTRLDRLYPRYRVPIELSELDLDRLEEVEAAIVAYPHGAAAPVVADAPRARDPGRRPLRRLPPPRPAHLRELVRRRTASPSCSRAPSTACPSSTATRVRDAELVANPGCYPTAALLALAPLAERGPGRRRGDRRQVRASRAPGAAAARPTTSRSTRTPSPYAIEGHRHRPEIEQELAGSGAEVEVTFVPHLLPLDQGLLVELLRATSEPVDASGARALRRALRGRALRARGRAPAGRARGPRHEPVPVYVTVEERGRVLAFAAIDNLWKGAAGPGDPEPEPDAGARRGRGAEMSGPGRRRDRRRRVPASSARAGSQARRGSSELDPDAAGARASGPPAPPAG